MKFIDEININLQAGNGGPGATSFRREKFVPFGGPDGGDGGHGGSVYFVSDPNKLTLYDLQFTPNVKAEDGKKGEGANKTGRSGNDVIIPVPLGTQVLRAEDDSFLADITEIGQKVRIAKGGRGGKGNNFFKSATNQTPTHHQPGEAGDAFEVKLSLKLIAHVGLLGLPNAGKSTFISSVSAAKPKIADYPFTTLEPNLGVARSKSGFSFVIADIPGLIPGAHKGKGLGIRFLKHVERTLVLLHLVEVSGLIEAGGPEDLLEAYDSIHHELEMFSPTLAARKEIVVLTKTDLLPDQKKLNLWVKKFQKRGHEVFTISSATNQGLEELLERLADILREDLPSSVHLQGEVEQGEVEGA